jgi:hypothetical protein
MNTKKGVLAAGRPSDKKQSLVDLMSDEEPKQQMKRVSLDLEVDTFKKLKLYALENGFKSTADVLRDLINQNIK